MKIDTTKFNDKKSKNINLDKALEEVKEKEMAQISFWLPKELRIQFKHKAEKEGLTMKEVLVRFVNSFISLYFYIKQLP